MKKWKRKMFLIFLILSIVLLIIFTRILIQKSLNQMIHETREIIITKEHLSFANEIKEVTEISESETIKSVSCSLMIEGYSLRIVYIDGITGEEKVKYYDDFSKDPKLKVKYYFQSYGKPYTNITINIVIIIFNILLAIFLFIVFVRI